MPPPTLIASSLLKGAAHGTIHREPSEGVLGYRSEVILVEIASSTIKNLTGSRGGVKEKQSAGDRRASGQVGVARGDAREG